MLWKIIKKNVQNIALEQLKYAQNFKKSRNTQNMQIICCKRFDFVNSCLYS